MESYDALCRNAIRIRAPSILLWLTSSLSNCDTTTVHDTPFRKQTETKTCETVLVLKLNFIDDGTFTKFLNNNLLCLMLSKIISQAVSL